MVFKPIKTGTVTSNPSTHRLHSREDDICRTPETAFFGKITQLILKKLKKMPTLKKGFS